MRSRSFVHVVPVSAALVGLVLAAIVDPSPASLVRIPSALQRSIERAAERIPAIGLPDWTGGRSPRPPADASAQSADAPTPLSTRAPFIGSTITAAALGGLASALNLALSWLRTATERAKVSVEIESRVRRALDILGGSLGAPAQGTTHVLHRPADSPAPDARAIAELARRELNAAQSLDTRRRSASLFRAFGVLHAYLGEWTAAEQCYRRALRLHPRSADALNGLAIAMRNTGRPREALSSLAAALDADPSHVEAWVSLGVLLHASGESAEACRATLEALSLNPFHGAAYNNLGNYLMAMGRSIDALEAFDAAIACGKSDPRPLNGRGNALAVLGDVHSARRAYHAALEMDPWYADAARNVKILDAGPPDGRA